MNNPFANLTEYELKHLVAHLESSELYDELHHLLEREVVRTEEIPVTRQGLRGWLDQLLGQKRTQQYIWYENAWYAAKQAIGDMNGFLNDVERAWRLAEQEASVPYSHKEHSQKWGKVIRYALIMTSVNSLAKTTPPALLVAIVEKGIWSPAQGLTFTCQIPDPRQQMEALIGLAPYLPFGLLNKALIAAREIQDEKCRVEALTEVAAYLPEKLKKETFRETLAAISEIADAEWQMQILTRVVLYLPRDLLGEILTTSKTIKNDRWRTEVLINLASCLTESLLTEALNFAKTIKTNRWRAQAMAGLAVYLPESLKVKTLQDALATAWEIEDERQKAEALENIAPYLTFELLVENIEVIEVNIEKWQQRQAPSEEDFYRTLFDHPPSEIPALIEADSKAKWYENVWTQTLAKMAVQLAKLGQPYEAFELIQTIESKIIPIETTIGIVPYLPQRLKEKFLLEVLAKVKELPEQEDNWNNDKSPQVEAMAELVVHLPPELMTEALVIIGSMNSPRWRAEGLARLAPYLPQNILSEALTIARTIIDEQLRAEALSGLALHLPSELVTETLAFVEAIEDIQGRAQVLVRLAPRLAELGYPDKALATIKSIVNEWGVQEPIAQALARLAPHLSQELLIEALAITNEINDQWWQTKALSSTSTYRSVELHKKTLAGEWHPLIEWGKDLFRRSARNHLHEIERWWREALTTPVPDLPQELQNEALSKILTKIRANEDQRFQAVSLTALASRLAERDYPSEALAVATAIATGVTNYRFLALAGLASQLVELGYSDEALVAAKRVRSPLHGDSLLAGLIYRLIEQGHPAEALAIIQELPEQNRDRISPRVQILIELIPYLPTDSLPEAFAAALSIQDNQRRAQVLAELSPRLIELPNTALVATWQTSLPAMARRTREDLLADLSGLAPLLQTVGGSEAVAETARAIQDVGRWWP